MYNDILTSAQKSALAILSGSSVARSFYLAGGTALALHLGHRESADFDFFCEQRFDPHELLNLLPPVRVLQAARDTLTIELNTVRTSFFGYPHRLLRPTVTGPSGFHVADVADIAAMKLVAIAGRGSRKDFVDVFFICRLCFPLKEAIQLLQAKFSSEAYDLYHILRSLTYFADAEAEPMPVLRCAVQWDEIKLFFQREAARLHG
ncbi:MAG: nucleotidyl transferase AbiEii/AbiGii toxin family protein [Verrucomicrobiae bacterium]|nr:nucleotidyl transferase AbiEii/AbiGii toxin family protein [Verrucomicrobiae bacterium]